MFISLLCCAYISPFLKPSVISGKVHPRKVKTRQSSPCPINIDHLALKNLLRATNCWPCKFPQTTLSILGQREVGNDVVGSGEVASGPSHSRAGFTKLHF